VVNYIRQKLSCGADILFQAFLTLDTDYDGLLSQREVLIVLRQFGVSAPSTPEETAERLCPHADAKIRFGELHAWVLTQPTGFGNTPLIGSYWWRDWWTTELNPSARQLPVFLQSLHDANFEIALNETRDRARFLEETERFRRSKFSTAVFSEAERSALFGMFERLIRNQEEKVLFVETELPKMASVLGYVLSFEELAMIRLVYADKQGNMDFVKFLCWWALRPQSGKSIPYS